MKKKIFLVILLVFFLTGCSAKYKINIVGNTIEETLVVEERNELISTTDVSQALEDVIAINADSTSEFASYHFEKNLGDFNSGLTLSRNYESANEYNYNSAILNKCYDSGTIMISSKMITITTSNAFKCFDIMGDVNSDITFEITTNYKVTSNNADVINGNTYTWSINQSDDDNHILMIIDKTSSGNIIEDIKNNEITQMVTIFATFGLVIVIIGYIIYNKYKKMNEI